MVKSGAAPAILYYPPTSPISSFFDVGQEFLHSQLAYAFPSGPGPGPLFNTLLYSFFAPPFFKPFDLLLKFYFNDGHSFLSPINVGPHSFWYTTSCLPPSRNSFLIGTTLGRPVFGSDTICNDSSPPLADIVLFRLFSSRFS